MGTPDDAETSTVHGQLDAIQQRLERGDRRMTAIEESLEATARATQRVEANTADLVEFFRAMQGAFKVLGWIGKAARPLGWIATAAAAIAGAWAVIKGGKS